MKYIYFVSYGGVEGGALFLGRAQITVGQQITDLDDLIAIEKKIAEDAKVSLPIITNFILLRTEAE